MNKKKEMIILYVLIIIELLILSNSKIVIKSVFNNSVMFLSKIMPSLFPTMVLGLLLVKNNITLIIPNIIKKLFSKLFNFNDTITSIFIMSMICGSPTNASIINDYLNKGLINDKEAENLLCITHFINPLFVISISSSIFNIRIAVLILIMLYTSNFIKAFILRNKFKQQSNNSININVEQFQITLIKSIKESINALLNIFGIVVLFSMLICLIKEVLNLNNTITIIINIILEMTSAVLSINNLNINYILKIIILYLSFNFGGLCIHMQTLSMIAKKNIRYLKYLIFRVV